MATLSARLAALEKDLHKAAQVAGGVVMMKPGEGSADAVARAVAQGRHGSFLVVPEAMAESEWEVMMQRSGEDGGTT